MNRPAFQVMLTRIPCFVYMPPHFAPFFSVSYFFIVRLRFSFEFISAMRWRYEKSAAPRCQPAAYRKQMLSSIEGIRYAVEYRRREYELPPASMRPFIAGYTHKRQMVAHNATLSSPPRCCLLPAVPPVLPVGLITRTARAHKRTQLTNIQHAGR